MNSNRINRDDHTNQKTPSNVIQSIKQNKKVENILLLLKETVSNDLKEYKRISQDTQNPSRKYFRRGEILDQRIYESNSQTKNEDNSNISSNSSDNEKNILSQSVTDQHDNETSTLSSDQTLLNGSQLTTISDDIIEEFRKLNQPISLFGETSDQRIHRLNRLKSIHDSQTRQKRSHVDIINKVDTSETQEVDFDIGKVSRSIQISFSNGEKIALRSGKKTSPSLYQSDSVLALTLVSAYFKLLLSEWAVDLDSRTYSECVSVQGKIATSTILQTRKYLDPLFKMLEKGSIDPNIALSICEICYYMQLREYVRANDAYLRFSIGNAPWPIGVTAVGIHERSSRERICSNQVAHALNDEVTRKWIQSVKRLITYSQSKYPPNNPSKAIG